MKKNRYKYWYIKERHNPQFKHPYYIGLGNISRKEASAQENTLYGNNYIHEYQDEESYLIALKRFQSKHK